MTGKTTSFIISVIGWLMVFNSVCFLETNATEISSSHKRKHGRLLGDEEHLMSHHTSLDSELQFSHHTHSHTSTQHNEEETPQERKKRFLQTQLNTKEKLERYSTNGQHHKKAGKGGEDGDEGAGGEGEGEIVGFYHVYADEANNYQRIVQEQMSHIEKTGLLDKVTSIFYNTIRVDYNLSFHYYHSTQPQYAAKYIHLQHLGEKGEEAQTVRALYDYCHLHPKAKVFYFHDKGSFHSTYFNEVFRHNLNCYVLTPHCIQALEDGYDTCGMRASPTPFIHYSGNFWWAKCSYVNTLIDPMSHVNNQTFIDVTAKLSHCIGTEARYFIESWIGSAPQIKPADCVSSEVDASYLYGYMFPPQFYEHCTALGMDSPRTDRVGLPCAAASTWKNAEAFHDAYDHIRELETKQCALTNLPAEVKKRTEYWYGQEPTFFLDWMNRIVQMRNISDGTAIRGVREVQCYYYKDKKIHAIPSAGALFRLGLSFNDIVVIPTYQIALFPRGEDVPP